MRYMTRLIKKLLVLSGLIIVTIIALVQYPSLFIRLTGEYKSFKIYSNQSIEIDQSVKTVLDSVILNLNESQFKDDSSILELYFVRGTLYEKLIRLTGMKNMAFSKFEKHIYSAHPKFIKGRLERNSNAYEWLNLVQIISHEGVHSQMYKDYYKYLKMTTPGWINEGYAEYISYRPIRERQNYELSDLLYKLESSSNEWLDTEYHSKTPRDYVQSRLLVEYLIEIYFE